MRTVVGKKCRHQRIRNGFECSVCEGKDEHAPKQKIEGCGSRGIAAIARNCGERYKRGQDVQKKRGYNELSVTNLIANDATDDDAETKARQSSGTDGAKLSTGKSELLAPVVKDSATNGETDTGCEDCHETRP